MKYKVEVTINCSLEKVHEKFIDLEKRKEWQNGLLFQSMISGPALSVGSQHEVVFDMGKSQITMIETIMENHLPGRIIASYETKGVYNVSDDRFESLDDSTTRYTSYQLFEMHSFMMKIMSVLMGKMFKKQTLDTMISFKQFCER